MINDSSADPAAFHITTPQRLSVPVVPLTRTRQSGRTASKTPCVSTQDNVWSSPATSISSHSSTEWHLPASSRDFMPNQRDGVPFDGLGLMKKNPRARTHGLCPR